MRNILKAKTVMSFLIVLFFALFMVSSAEAVTVKTNSDTQTEIIKTELNVTRTYKNKKIAIDGDKISVSFDKPQPDKTNNDGNKDSNSSSNNTNTDTNEPSETSETSDTITISGEAKIGNQKVAFVEKENKYVAEATISDLEDGKDIPIDCSEVTVKQGLDKEYKLANPTDTVTYYSPLTFNDITVKNTNKIPNIVIDGDTIEVSFKTNHPLDGPDGTYKIKIGDKEIEFKSEANNKYVAKYTIKPGDFPKECDISIEPSIEFTDVYGNKQTIKFAKTDFSYYQPISELISNFKVSTDSKYKDDQDTILVKKGNTISFSFDSKRKLGITEATVGNKKITFTATGGNHYVADFVVEDDLIDNEIINFKFVFNDIVGYLDYILSDKDFAPIRYYSDIKVSDVVYKSSNSNSPDIAKVGDTITLSFKTNHPTEIKAAKIGSGDIKIDTADKMNYSITTTVVEGEAIDLSDILYEVTITDKAENTPYLLKSDKGIKYYAPITISDLSLTSSNQKNNKTLCKNDDSINVSAQANHSVTGSGTICDVAPEINNNDKMVSMTIKATDNFIPDQSAVTFAMKLVDAAGNESPDLTQGNIGNQMIYYAPLTGNVTVTASGGKTPGYICNGGVVNANFPTQHNAAITQALISGTGATINGNNATLVFDGGFIPEGAVSYQLTKEDAAGNTLARTGTENIIYDRTAPSIKINPQLAGFSNGNVNVDVVVEDANIDSGDMHFNVNNTNMAAGGSLSNTTYQKRITLSDENDYNLNISSVDKAGNRSDLNGGRVIIDKTNPKITAININLEKVAVYKAGFILSQHFNFNDKFIKAVSCTLTEKTGFGGTSSWNINDPINNEGLKTAEITSTDMADNKSDVVRYSFYIDATAPKFILKSNDGATIKEDKNVEMEPGSNINVTLDKIWMGDEKPDHFTELVLKDKNGATVESYIKAGQEDHEKKISLNKKGEYILNCKAIDDVKNETKTIQYRFNVKEGAKPLVEQEAQNTINQGMIIGGIALVIAGIIAAVAFILFKRKAK